MNMLCEIVTYLSSQIKDSFRCDYTRSFNVLVELLHYAIRSSDQDLTSELISILSEVFDQQNKKRTEKNTCKSYPQEMYNFILETNELICRENYTQKLYQVSTNDYFIPINLLLPIGTGAHAHELCNEDYDVIWTCLLQILSYGRTELIMTYWERAVRYNEQLIDSEKFRLFNQEFCSLLMSYREYSLLYQIIYAYKEVETDTSNMRRILKAIHTPLIVLEEKEVVFRYLNYLYSTITIHRFVPHQRATTKCHYPLQEYAKHFFALLYVLSKQKTSGQLSFDVLDALPIPNKMTKDTISRYLDALEKSIANVKNDDDLSAIFGLDKSKSLLNPLQDFRQYLHDYFWAQKSIDNLSTDKIDVLEKIICSEAEKAFKRCDIFKNKHYFKNKSFSSSNAQELIRKELLELKSDEKINERNIEDFREHIFCSVVKETVNSLTLLAQNAQEISQTQLNQQLSQWIKAINKKEKYIIVADSLLGESLLRSNLKYDKGKAFYQDVQFFCPPIYTPQKQSCTFWFLKKEELPYCVLKDTETNPYWGEYRLSRIAEGSYLLLLDLGKTPKNIVVQMKPYLDKNGVASPSDVVYSYTHLSILSYFPTRNSAKTICVVDADSYNPSSDLDEWYEDDGEYEYQSFQEWVEAQQLSVEEQNKLSEDEERRLRKKQ